jgi:Ca2+-binding RTX toxin-like protein
MANTITGTTLDENLTGTAQDDQITGLAGNDTILGNAGDDLIYGNQGNDVIDNTAAGAIGSDTIYGGQGNDNIGFFGTMAGNDLLYGNFHNDEVVGGAGSDTLYGGQDNDTVAGVDGRDLLYGYLGNDNILGGAGDDTMYGGQGNDSFRSEAGDDLVYGNFADDILNQPSPINGGNDTLYGGQGNDLIIEANGVAGVDRMFGNLGADTFDFQIAGPTVSGQTDATADHIVDFKDSENDRVKVVAPSGIVYGETQGDSTVVSVQTAITWAQNHNLNGTPGNSFNPPNVVFVAGVNDGYLLVDANNNGAFGGGDYAIVLDNLNNLSFFGPQDVFS